MRPYLPICATVTMLVLSGCMVGPKYVKPAAPLAPAFKETTDWKEGDGWKIAKPNDALLRGKWWVLYGDAKLNELEEQVDPSNQTLKIAEANFRQARAAIRFNRAAEAPTIGTSPSISGVRDSANRPYFPPSLANNGSGDFTLPFDLSYEIDLWGRVRRTVTAAREEAQASAADLETARLSLHAELAVDYFEVRSADAQENLLNDTVDAYSKALELTKNRFQGGAAPKSDVAQAQTQLDAARVLATDIMVQREQYEHALAILIGKPPAAFAVGPGMSETLFDGGRRRATTESARAGYDASVANYRQSVLTSFQQVEDNLVVLRVLSTESVQQHEATASAEESLRLFQNRYAGGVDTYLQVVTSQTTALANERNDIDLMRRRLEANVLLIKAVGGGWDVSTLPRL